MPTTGIGDTYSPLLSYALRLTKSTYTGYCLKLRKTVIGIDQYLDVGFDGSGIFDWAAATIFAAGGDVFVRKYYSQGSLSISREQTTNSKQPKLNLTTHQIESDGVDDFLVTDSTVDLSATDKLSLYIKQKRISASGTYEIFLNSGGTNYIQFYYDQVLSKVSAVEVGSGANFKNDSTGVSTSGVERIWSIIVDRAQNAMHGLKLYADGVEQTASNASNDNNGNFANEYFYFGSKDGTLYAANLQMSEFHLFAATHNSTDQAIIEADIAAGLGVSPPDTTRPSDVTNLAITKNSETSISITSDDATDNVAVTEYPTEVSEDNFSTHTTLASTAKNITFVSGDTGFPTSVGVHSLKFRRKAKDGAGNLSLNYSNIPSAVTITILPTPPVAGFAFTGLNGEGKLEASDNLGITDSSTGSSRTYQWKVNGTIVAPTTATPNLTKFLSMGNNTIRQTVTNDGGNDYVEHTVNVIAKYFEIAGGTETKVITGLQTGLKLKGSVKAVDNVGNESDYSNEDSATVL